MRIVFPTKENLSYMSQVANNLTDADYLTVLNLSGDMINSVEMLKNDKDSTSSQILERFETNNFDVLVVPEASDLQIEVFKNKGISIFLEKDSKKVLDCYSNFVQNKLVQL